MERHTYDWCPLVLEQPCFKLWPGGGVRAGRPDDTRAAGSLNALLKLLKKGHSRPPHPLPIPPFNCTSLTCKPNTLRKDGVLQSALFAMLEVLPLSLSLWRHRLVHHDDLVMLVP